MFCSVISWTSFFSLLLSFPFIARRHSAPLSWLIETIHWTYIFISHIFPFSRSIHLNKLHKQKLFSALLLMSCEYRRKLPFFMLTMFMQFLTTSGTNAGLKPPLYRPSLQTSVRISFTRSKLIDLKHENVNDVGICLITGQNN